MMQQWLRLCVHKAGSTRWRLAVLLLGAAFLCGCNNTSSSPESPALQQAAAPVASPVTKPASSPVPVATIRFTDVTAAAGVQFQHEAGASGHKWYPETMGAGGGFFDYDGDGQLDIVLINGRRWPGERQLPEPTMRLYRNLGDGTFRDVTVQSRLNVPLYGMGMAAADYDNDGDQDLMVTGYGQTLFYRNQGDGTFTESSTAVGIPQGGWSTAAAFVDIDRDGWLDLLIGYYVDWAPERETNLDCTYGTPAKDYCAVKYFQGQGLKLFRNLGDGRLQDVTVTAGVSAPEARVLGISIVDYNDDGWPDIVVANDLTPSLLFANQGDGTLREIGAPAGLVLDEGGVAFAGMGIDSAFVANDARLCVAIGNFAGQPTTLHCQTRGKNAVPPDLFVEQSQPAGIARSTLHVVTFGLFFFDADLDGWQDLFLVNGHVVHEEPLRNVPYAQLPQLLRNRGDGTFAEVEPGTGSGLDTPIVGRGGAYADYDNDGDLDVLLTANQGAASLLRNDTPRQGHFLRVVTQGTQSNRDGIGTRLRLRTNQRQLRGMVRTGSSYLSQSTLAVTFGLAADEQPQYLDVLWPSGQMDRLSSLSRDTTLIAREGAAPATDVVSPPATVSAPAATSPRRTAIAHYQQGRLAAAVQAFQQALAQHPDDYIAQQYLIELYWRQGQQEAARALLTDMSQLMPEANFLMQFAFHLEAQQLRDLADEVYRAALQRDPLLAEAHYRLGKNALQVGHYDTAVQHFQQALALHPELIEAAHGLGLVYAAQGRTAVAETQFQAVLRQAPDFVEAYVHLGSLYNHTGRLAEAETAYRQVITLQPERAQGYHNLGVVLAAQGRTEEAMAQFQAALQRDPRLLAAHNDLGTLYAEQGKLSQAIAAFQAALDIDAASVPAHYNLALAYGAMGDYAAMQQWLEATLQLEPRHVEAHLNLGVLSMQRGRVEVALQQFRTAVDLAPQRAEAHYFLAVAYGQLGQQDAMLGALQRALDLNPQHAGAHNAIAALYFDRQQYDLAWQHAQQAARLGAPAQPLLEALQRLRQ